MIQNRAELKQSIITKHILTNNKNIEKYFLRFNDINDRVKDSDSNFHKQWYKYYINENNIHDLLSSGINNLQYKILEKKVDPTGYIEYIKVSI